MRGIGKIQYDPTLDDESLSNYCYMIDTRHLMLKVMDGEDMKELGGFFLKMDVVRKEWKP